MPGRLALAGFNGLGLLEGFPGLVATSTTQRRDIGRAAAEIITLSLKAPERGRGERVILQPTVHLGALKASSSL